MYFFMLTHVHVPPPSEAKLKHQSLEQRKVYCRTMQRRAHDKLVQFSDWLLVRQQGGVTGLTLSVLRLQKSWGYVLMIIK